MGKMETIVAKITSSRLFVCDAVGCKKNPSMSVFFLEEKDEEWGNMHLCKKHFFISHFKKIKTETKTIKLPLKSLLRNVFTPFRYYSM